MRTVKIGLPVSLTGDYSVQGRESLRGVTLWVSDVNSRGGIFVKDYGKNIPIELIHYDDRSSAERCGDLTARLISRDKVDLLLGPYSSSLALASAEVAEEHGKTLWNHGGSTDEVEARAFNFVVSAITPASKYSAGIIEAVRKSDRNADKIAIFSAVNSGFSRNIARGAQRYGLENGFLVEEFSFMSGEQDLSRLLEKVSDFGPDLIMGMGRAHDDLLLARQLIERKVKAKSIALVVASIRLFKDTINEYAEGFLSASQWESGAALKPDTGPTPEEFQKGFVAAYGEEPDYVAAQGYNIGVIIQKCIRDAGTIEDRVLREAALRLDLNTFYGNFKTDSRGNQTGHEMFVVQWLEGKKVIVHPESSSQAELVYPAPFKY
ncbi:MAG: amino acid ABC transporter substrate-binding protein [Deltaproteobacteria bacterium]